MKNMKIITNTKRNGKLCYVQVRDVLFLARMTGNKRLMEDYLKYINAGKSDYEFIKVSGDSYIKAFELCDYIIDFGEYNKRDIGINYLTNMVKNKAYVVHKDRFGEEGMEHQIDALRDVMAYKRGELEYKIPMVADGRLEYTSNDNMFTLDSTIFDNCYVVSTTSGLPINEIDYSDFLEESLNKIFEGVSKEERLYDTFVVGKVLVIKVRKKEVEKKKSIVGKVLAKIKKEN